MIIIRGNSRNLTILLQGLCHNPDNTVTVVYIGPVPQFSAVAFVLVLEALGYKPTQYTIVELGPLFKGNKVPRKIITSLPEKSKRTKQAIISLVEELQKSGN